MLWLLVWLAGLSWLLKDELEREWRAFVDVALVVLMLSFGDSLAIGICLRPWLNHFRGDG